jgi:thiol-activated cytolysin
MKRIGVTFFVMAAALSGCVAQEENLSEIDLYIRGIGKLPVSDPKVVEGQKNDPVLEGDYSCTTQDFSETRRYDEIVAYSANSDSLWPGAILRGDSVYEGLFTQTVFARKPLAVSVSLENLSGSPSAVMASPSLSEFRNAISQIMSSEVNGATPANIYAEIEEVHSQKQLALALGAGFSAVGVPFSIAASFNFDDQTKRSRYLVKYVQAYYTVDVDQPGKPSDFLADSVTLEEVEQKFGTDNPPVFVSSITYGRTVLFTFESEFSATEMGSALEFVYHGGADVGGSVSVNYSDMISSSNITAYILGGSGGDAAQTIDGYEALKQFLRSGGNYSPDSPGAPIAYKLAYLADNSPSRLSFADEYQVKDCVRINQKVLVTFDSITVEAAPDEIGSEGDLELYGTVHATANNEVTLWDRAASQYIRINENETYPAPGAPALGEGILQVTPAPGSSINLIVDLYEADIFGDDNFPVVTLERSFEAGWRDSVELVVTSGGARVRVTLSLRPI